MGLIKLVILIVLLLACLTLWRRLQAWRQANGRQQAAEQAQPERMVRCQNCQVHLPEHQAIQSGQRWYCSREHLDADHA
jgi:uncharacterized protein